MLKGDRSYLRPRFVVPAFLFLSLLNWTVSTFLSSAFAQQKERVNLRLDWLYGPTHTPFFLAIEKGYYDQENISVDMLEGRGSMTTVQTVAAGSDHFGFADFVAVAYAVEKGAPVKAIFSLYQKNPNSIISLVATGIKEPKDLIGKSVAVTPGSSGTRLLPGFLELNNVDPNKVNTVSVDPRAKMQLVLLGKADSFLGYSIFEVPLLESQGHKLNVLRWADWKIKLLSGGMITGDKIISSRPGLVRGFLRATAKGWQEGMKNPAAALETFLKRFPDKERGLSLKIIQATLELLVSETTLGKPVGWQANEDWESTQDLLLKYGGLGTKLPITKYFTNQFVPD